MRYTCPKCGEVFAVKPADATCPICDAPLVAESGTHEAETHGEHDGLPSPKRKF